MSGLEVDGSEGGRKPRAVSRRRAREVALQVLYAIDLAEGRPRPTLDRDEKPANLVIPIPTPAMEPQAVFDAVAAHFEMPDGARAFARELALSVRAQIEPVDAAIKAHARNWRIERMAAVDRNILRLGTYELSFTETPAPVVLNEAVDLARRFGSDPSPAFVNGILDAIAQGAREQDS